MEIHLALMVNGQLLFALETNNIVGGNNLNSTVEYVLIEINDQHQLAPKSIRFRVGIRVGVLARIRYKDK
jgi:hypothetical protein